MSVNVDLWKVFTLAVGILIMPLAGWVWQTNLSVAETRNDLGDLEVKVSNANRFKLFDIVKTVKEIIYQEKENKNEIYLNVASGSKIHSVGLMMACMIFDERSDIHPFYAQAKQYLHTKVSEPQTKGIKEIHHLPTYQIMTPKLEHLLALKIINENGGKIKETYGVLCQKYKKALNMVLEK